MSQRTKDKVANAAVHLFYLKGFHGTSVRDIASNAKVNVSMISYYFKNKQGLLEYLIIEYYETYLEKLEAAQKEMDSTENPKNQMNQLIDTIIHYKHENHQFTGFIQRELSKDNVLVRELLVTYLAKEKFILEEGFYRLINSSSHSTIEKEMLFFQFYGLLHIPFNMSYEWKNIVGMNRSTDLYIETYKRSIKNWIDTLIGSEKAQ
ncbi:DNA-binding transcriptional regulator, AcrR family [Salinibacillus kushneri]|uniref:DNA-binding transcriptional regulator, AcrR family n=1 Tax=Salinibacillus kushneri TaxID=237682 RepID=A0A1I0HCB6_9BACI|nr:forespore capture DNA-binding protein RefZ [Salinibacillus kushneri]SET80507.1 DNA-binding transcriptional regulator, AcrR family [Salinibacillus kushneri]